MFKCAREHVGGNGWPCRMLSRDGLGCFLGPELEAILEEDGGWSGSISTTAA